MARNNRLTGAGKSPLFQMWTTYRFRLFLKAAAAQLNTTQAAIVREATWDFIQKKLPEKVLQRLERQATRHESKET